MPDLAEAGRDLRIRVASDVGRAKHAARYTRHPLETLRVHVSRETWQDWLDREWWVATRARDYEASAPRSERLDALSALDAASLGSLDGAKLYGLALGSISDPSVPYGRAAVTCSWQTLVADGEWGPVAVGTLDHPMGDVVELTSERQRGWSFSWYGEIRASMQPSGLRRKQHRGFPRQPSGVLSREVSQLVCSWRPRGSA